MKKEGVIMGSMIAKLENRSLACLEMLRSHYQTDRKREWEEHKKGKYAWTRIFLANYESRFA